MQIKAVLFDMFDTLALIDNYSGAYDRAIECMHKYVVKQGINVAFEQILDAYIKARDELRICVQ
jgi:hypothetical protein